MYSNTETMATCEGCLFKSGDFAGKFEQLVWIIIDARYLFDCKVLLLDRYHYFALLTMHDVPKKCACCKAFCFVATAQFYAKKHLLGLG